MSGLLNIEELDVFTYSGLSWSFHNPKITGFLLFDQNKNMLDVQTIDGLI